MYSSEVVKQRNVSTALDLTGLNRHMWRAGGNLRDANFSSPAAAAGGGDFLGAARKVRSDAVDLEFMYDWFHNDSPDVEPDKTVKWAYKKKKIFCAGKTRMITCRPRVLTCSVAEAVQHAMESDVYRNSGITVHPKAIAACICHCTKPAKREECACPTCTEFIEALTAYNKKRPAWHADDEAQCTGACGLDCKNKESEFRSFSRNHSVFEAAIRCAKVGRPELQLPHEVTRERARMMGGVARNYERRRRRRRRSSTGCPAA